MAGSGNLSKASDDQRPPTAHRPTVPPTGERTVIVITIAFVLIDHFILGICHSSRLSAKGSGVKPQSLRIVISFYVISCPFVWFRSSFPLNEATIHEITRKLRKRHESDHNRSPFSLL